MTEAELLAAAAAAAKATTISGDEYLHRVATNPGYDYMHTSWHKAISSLEAMKHLTPSPPPPPPSPPTSLAGLAQNVMFTAWTPMSATRCPTDWKIALSADPAYDGAVRAAAPQLKAAGYKIAVWGNQDQVGIARIKTVDSSIGAGYMIFQAETAAEYDSAIAATAKVIVGNPNAWTADQRTHATNHINAGVLTVIFETYTNEGSPWPIESSAAGVPVSSMCPGVGWGRYPYHLRDYQPHTASSVWPGICVYLAEDCDSDDFSRLP